MSEPTQPGSEPAPAPEPVAAPSPEPSPSPAPSDAPITAREAANIVSGQPDDQSADKADAAPPREPSGDQPTEATRDPGEAPPIEPPRSWDKARKAEFAALPRDTQEYLVALDRTRELEVRRVQNEAAERAKALEAQAQQVEQTRQYLEQQALPDRLRQLYSDIQQEFGQPTIHDVDWWAQNDLPKWARWQTAVQRVQAAESELQQQQWQRQQQQIAEQQQFEKAQAEWLEEQGNKFKEARPEWKDEKTFHTRQADVLEYLAEIGLPRETLANLARQNVPISMHSAPFQIMADDATNYRKAQKAARSPSQRSVPPVQRPGSAPARGEAQDARLKELSRQLDRTGSIRDAARLAQLISRS